VSTSLWFIPTQNILTSYENGKIQTYIVGNVGSPYNYEENTKPLSGKFVLSCSRLDAIGYRNFILTDESVFQNICTTLRNDNTCIKIVINEEIDANNFNQFIDNTYTLNSYQSATKSKAIYDSSAFSLRNFEHIKDYFERGGDYQNIVNEIDSHIAKNCITDLTEIANTAGLLLDSLSTCRNITYLFKPYLASYTGSKVKDEQFVEVVKSYIRSNIPSDGLLEFYRESWAHAYYMTCEEFNKTFTEIADSKDESWTALNFVKYAREKILIPNSCIREFNEMRSPINTLSIEECLSAYKALNIKSVTFEKCFVNILMIEIDAQATESIKQHKNNFWAQQFMFGFFSALIWAMLGVESFFLSFILLNVIWRKQTQNYFNSSNIRLSEDSLPTLKSLINQVESSKLNGLFLSTDLERTFNKYVD
jgi:hypothetical protein